MELNTELYATMTFDTTVVFNTSVVYVIRYVASHTSAMLWPKERTRNVYVLQGVQLSSIFYIRLRLLLLHSFIFTYYPSSLLYSFPLFSLLPIFSLSCFIFNIVNQSLGVPYSENSGFDSRPGDSLS